MTTFNILAQSDQGGGIIGGLFGLVIFIIIIVSLWKLFEKAGKPGWAALIPIYNLIVYMQIINKPVWMIILAFIPVVNVFFAIYWGYCFVRAFGGGIGMFLGYMFLPFITIPYMAFGPVEYQGAVE